eukprot:gnl/TRDRNA2_/TRDRNA2_135874_c1_seq2.p1 gnl/TRDRNA2_/TRDRNA2_135874_c1~~gnl/TRDRNA2_/TRDRNA2_135874_c1_seq2.p1  ORF type:complete len:541 (-),score=88.29 gnl/TRDRNA2_/TRDRNA2_135874_c1_seq2:92-1507(-)
MSIATAASGEMISTTAEMETSIANVQAEVEPARSSLVPTGEKGQTSFSAKRSSMPASIDRSSPRTSIPSSDQQGLVHNDRRRTMPVTGTSSKTLLAPAQAEGSAATTARPSVGAPTGAPVTGSSGRASSSQAMPLAVKANGDSDCLEPVAAPVHREPQTPLRLVAGAHTMQGRKLNYPGCPNQDNFLVVPFDKDQMLIVVFDGHGLEGHNVVHRARQLFEEHARSLRPGRSSSSSAIVDNIRHLFRLTHTALEREGLSSLSGTTATAAVIDAAASIVIVAHVGDSRLMISTGAHVDFITADHHIDAAAEHQITASGGEVRTAELGSVMARRVYLPGQNLPGLSMCRALGDSEAASVGVTCDPEVDIVQFRPGSLLVIASDGVWEQMTGEDVAGFMDHKDLGESIVSEGSRASESTRHVPQDMGALASSLVTQARSLWDSSGDIDDITAVVVKVFVQASSGRPSRMLKCEAA